MVYFAQIWRKAKWCVSETISILNQHTNVIFIIKFNQSWLFPMSTVTGSTKSQEVWLTSRHKLLHYIYYPWACYQGMPRCFHEEKARSLPTLMTWVAPLDSTWWERTDWTIANCPLTSVWLQVKRHRQLNATHRQLQESTRLYSFLVF